MALLLYLATAAALLALWSRFVQRVALAPTVVLVLLPMLFTGRALLTNRVYAPIDLPFQYEPLKSHAAQYGAGAMHDIALSDLHSQIIPWQKAVRYALAQGEWPLWNPFILCGDILAAAAQPAVYDPFHLIALLLPLPLALTFGASITFFLAGFFTYAFARQTGRSELASLVAAAGFTFSAIFAFFVGWPLARAWAFLPLVLFAVRNLVREPGLRTAAWLAASFVLLIFAGHPETVLHVVAIGIVYGLFNVAPHFSGAARPAEAGRYVVFLYALGAGVLALLLTAISLLPFLSVAPHTSEYEVRREHYATKPIATSALNVMVRASRAAYPFFGGQPERDNLTPLWDPTAPRVGAIVLGLAVAALIVARRKETWFFFALAVVTLLAAFEAPPVVNLLHSLPLFDIALNERLAFAAAFALSILAAFAIDALRARTTGIVLLVTGVLLVIGAYALWDVQVNAGVDPELMRALLFVELVPLLVAALLLLFRTPARIALPLVLGLVLLQRTFADGNIYPVLWRKAFYPIVPVVRTMKDDKRVPFRVVGNYFSFIPNGAALYGLEDVRGYEAMTFKRLTETFPLWCVPQPVSFNVVTDLTRPFLSFLNVRYAVAAGDAEPPDGWRLVMQDRNTRLFENTRALPRVFVPRRIRYE
ncbi:MAG TPA: hypothetical protein VG106_14345, partial [Vicinamibacterales bacterium]|nr:hypothetical protein [Vicinamibacterales bacterium]